MGATWQQKLLHHKHFPISVMLNTCKHWAICLPSCRGAAFLEVLLKTIKPPTFGQEETLIVHWSKHTYTVSWDKKHWWQWWKSRDLKTDNCATLVQHFSILISWNTLSNKHGGSSEDRHITFSALSCLCGCAEHKQSKILVQWMAAEQASTGAREERNNEGKVLH